MCVFVLQREINLQWPAGMLSRSIWRRRGSIQPWLGSIGSPCSSSCACLFSSQFVRRHLAMSGSSAIRRRLVVSNEWSKSIIHCIESLTWQNWIWKFKQKSEHHCECFQTHMISNEPICSLAMTILRLYFLLIRKKWFKKTWWIVGKL